MNKTENRFQKEQTLLAQAHETINAVLNSRLSSAEALAELRSRLVDAIDDFLIEEGTAVALTPLLGVTLMNSALGEEPNTELGYSEIGSVIFDEETGQTRLAEDGIADDEDNPCYDYTTDNLDCQDLTMLLARLVNTRLAA